MQRSNQSATLGVRKTAVETWLCLLAVALAILVYLSLNFMLPRMLTGSFNTYVAQPLLWSYLALLAFLSWKYEIRNKPRLTRPLVLTAFLAGAFQIAVLVIAGLLYGFGHSPYSHQPSALLGNAVYVTSMLLGVEMCRASILGALGKRRPLLALALASLFFSLLSLPAGIASAQGDMMTFFRTTGETFLPSLSENMLASFLALVGGPVAPLIYRITLRAFEWSSPILPNLPWTVTAFLGTMIPASALLVIQKQTLPQSAAPAAARPQMAHTSNSWLVVAVVVAALVWFNTGLFGVRPTLISGVSMSPTFVAGDLAIIRDVPAEAVKVGDIIRYRRGETYILHRVVGIQQDETGTLFVTRGDANNVDDLPVPASALDGRLVLIVPKIGWVGIGVRQLIEWIR